MTLSHLQDHSYCKPFKRDFYPCDAMLGLSVRHKSELVAKQPNVASLKQCCTIARNSYFEKFSMMQKISTEVVKIPVRYVKIAFFDWLRSLHLRCLTAEMYPLRSSTFTTVRWWRNTRCRQQLWWLLNLVIAAMVQLSSITLVVWEYVDDTRGIPCLLCDSRLSRVKNGAGSGLTRDLFALFIQQ